MCVEGGWGGGLCGNHCVLGQGIFLCGNYSVLEREIERGVSLWYSLCFRAGIISLWYSLCFNAGAISLWYSLCFRAGRFPFGNHSVRFMAGAIFLW